MPFRWFTAGESHGPSLVVIIDGLPAGLSVDISFIRSELARRRKGYGRGNRMKIEGDEPEVVAGIRGGKTLGSPVAILIRNRDYENWQEAMDPFFGRGRELTSPRPGHADLAGGFKYGHSDLRNVLERASARETAARVAAGALAKLFLASFEIFIQSHTVAIGNVYSTQRPSSLEDWEMIETSPVRCLNEEKATQMMELIKKAQEEGDTLGGMFEIIVWGVPPGLGSYTQWDKRLDGKLGQALLSIPSVKGVEIGEARFQAEEFGSKAHDEIFFEEDVGFFRKTNFCGGLEGGITNGEDIVLKCLVKPIPTLRRPLRSVDISTKELVTAGKERADVCVVPAAGVVGEAMTALVLVEVFLDKFGGDNLEDIKKSFNTYLSRIEWKRRT